MKSCDVTHQVIETVTCNTHCSIKVYTMEFFHDLCMIRDLKIRYLGLTETLNFHVFAVILTDRHRRIDDVRDDHHSLLNFFLQLSLLFFLLLRCRPFGLLAFPYKPLILGSKSFLLRLLFGNYGDKLRFF